MDVEKHLFKSFGRGLVIFGLSFFLVPVATEGPKLCVFVFFFFAVRFLAGFERFVALEGLVATMIAGVGSRDAIYTR